MHCESLVHLFVQLSAAWPDFHQCCLCGTSLSRLKHLNLNNCACLSTSPLRRLPINAGIAVSSKSPNAEDDLEAFLSQHQWPGDDDEEKIAVYVEDAEQIKKRKVREASPPPTRTSTLHPHPRSHARCARPRKPPSRRCQGCGCRSKSSARRRRRQERSRPPDRLSRWSITIFIANLVLRIRLQESNSALI